MQINCYDHVNKSFKDKLNIHFIWKQINKKLRQLIGISTH